MSRLGLTLDERRLVSALARDQSHYSVVGLYAVMIAPALLFAALGIVTESVASVVAGFCTLLASGICNDHCPRLGHTCRLLEESRRLKKAAQSRSNVPTTEILRLRHLLTQLAQAEMPVPPDS